MSVYLLLIILLISGLNNNIFQKHILSVTIIYMLALSFLRYEVGTDYKSYFLAIENNVYWFNDKGLNLVSDFLRNFMMMDTEIIIGTWAIFIMVITLYFLKYYADNTLVLAYSLFFFVTLYYYIDSHNIIRQYVALSIFFVGIIFLEKNRVIMFILFGALSTWFHITSSIFIILILMLYLIDIKTEKFEKKKYLLIFLGVISFGLTFIDFNKYILIILNFLNFDGRLNYYLLYANDHYLQHEISLPLAIFLIFKLFLFIYSVSNLSKLSPKIKNSKLVISIYIISTILSLVFYPILIFRRALIYITVFEVVVLADLLKKESIGLKSLIVLVSVIYFLMSISLNYSTPLPYKIWIDPYFTF